MPPAGVFRLSEWLGGCRQKRDDMSTHKVKTVIEGTPFEAGAGVWENGWRILSVKSLEPRDALVWRVDFEVVE